MSWFKDTLFKDTCKEVEEADLKDVRRDGGAAWAGSAGGAK
jgi:hypothetical protein